MSSPRIYTYKITFPDQGWWYWGVHKEKEYGEEYWGSPATHREKWKWFEFEKQILEFFDTWDEAVRVERRLVKPDLNNPLCLNEGAGRAYSLETMAKGGKIGGPIGGKKSRPSLEGRVKLSQTAKNTLKKYPHVIEQFREAGAKARRKSVKVVCLSTRKEEIFESISEACRVKSLTASAVTGVLQGKFKQHKGYFFEVV
jgi:hypothetical protein